MRLLYAEYKSPWSFLYQDSFPASSQLLSQDTQLLSRHSTVLEQSCTKLSEHGVAVLKGGRSQLEIKANKKIQTVLPLTDMLSKCCLSIHHEK